MLLCKNPSVESRTLRTILEITVVVMLVIFKHSTNSYDHVDVLCRKEHATLRRTTKKVQNLVMFSLVPTQLYPPSPLEGTLKYTWINEHSCNWFEVGLTCVSTRRCTKGHHGHVAELAPALADIGHSGKKLRNPTDSDEF